MLRTLTAPALLLAFVLCNQIDFEAGVVGTRGARAAEPDIIDTHIHLWDTARPGGVPWPPSGSPLYRPYMPADFAEVSVPAGNIMAVIVEASGLVEDNQWVLDLMAKEPSLLALVGNLQLGAADFAQNLERFAAHPRFAGIRRFNLKAKDLEDAGIMASLRDLQARNLALDLAMSGGMTLADASALAAALPKLRIVVNHVAGQHIDGAVPDSAWVSGIHALAQHPNVYMKISGLYQNTKQKPAPVDVGYYASTIDVLWDAFGEDHLVYGSNWPVSTLYGDYKPNVDIVRAYLAGKPGAARQKVLWRNAVKAYNLKLED